jgi:Tfp pilus assembly protein PilX
MRTTPTPQQPTGFAQRESERGAALILSLLVALVLVFLGMGLLLQTSLGLQASGTDRWVTKALYAADAGAMMQIEMIQMGVVGAPGTFILEDDTALPGLLKGQFTVTVSQFCESEPAQPMVGFEEGYLERHFYLRSEATRNIGDLTGMTRAAVQADVVASPFHEDAFEAVGECY